MTTRIAIVDDHPLVLSGIQSMLADTQGLEVVGTYTTGEETLSKLKADAPDVLLLDINLPDEDGIKLSKKISGAHPHIKIIALTNYDEIAFVRRILANGASGYLLKNTQRLELIEAIKTVLSGEQYLQETIEKKLLGHVLGKRKKADFIPKLTRREQEVLEGIAEELTTQEIAEKLFISIKTVETHRMNLMSKLGARNSVGIVKIALQKQLL